jgi:hypothetical protein
MIIKMMKMISFMGIRMANSMMSPSPWMTMDPLIKAVRKLNTSVDPKMTIREEISDVAAARNISLIQPFTLILRLNMRAKLQKVQTTHNFKQEEGEVAPERSILKSNNSRI